MKSLKLQNKILVIYYLIIVNIVSSHKNTTKIDSNEKGSHLKYEYVKRVCSNRVICKSDDPVVCTVRIFGGKTEYMDFENSCFLFLNNMCTDFGKEYNILSSGTCKEYFKSRRHNNPTPNDKTTATKFSVTKKAARMEKYNFSVLYEVNRAFDDHVCPLSCPSTYKPVCVILNRFSGPYLKMFSFANHCLGDLYYCKHVKDFSAPPDDSSASITNTRQSWRLCAADRYLQFARFSEIASSLGHYGWLAGDHRLSYILKPHERRPGYGKL